MKKWLIVVILMAVGVVLFWESRGVVGESRTGELSPRAEEFLESQANDQLVVRESEEEKSGLVATPCFEVLLPEIVVESKVGVDYEPCFVWARTLNPAGVMTISVKEAQGDLAEDSGVVMRRARPGTYEELELAGQGFEALRFRSENELITFERRNGMQLVMAWVELSRVDETVINQADMVLKEIRLMGKVEGQM